MNTRNLCVAMLIMLCVPATTTAEAGDRFGFGLKAGTYGFGFDFGVTVVKHVGIRASLQRASFSISESLDDADYDGDFDLGGTGLLVDVYPTGKQFRITLGLFDNRNQASVKADPNEPIEIGDNTYSPAEVGTLSGVLGFDSTVPYFGIGLGHVSRGKKRVRFLFDIGVIKQGSGTVRDFTSSTGLVSQADLDREAKRIEDDIKDYQYWPVISFGIAIRI